jgi:hypothetical protein
MASIEKRITKEGKVKYLARVRLKGKKPESAIFDRLTDARRWANSIESAIHENRHFKTAESKKRTLAVTARPKGSLRHSERSEESPTAHFNDYNSIFPLSAILIATNGLISLFFIVCK